MHYTVLLHYCTSTVAGSDDANGDEVIAKSKCLHTMYHYGLCGKFALCLYQK